MKPRMRVLGWFIAIASFNGMGCGGGDDSINFTGGAFDGAAEADVARPDGGHPGDADAGATAKDGNDARPGADAPGTPDSKPDGPFVDGPSADAPKDASLVDQSDARETSGGDSDGDAQSQPESSTDSDAPAYDADANGPDAQDAFTAVDATPDVTPDESTDAGDERSNPDAAADSDGSPPEMVHWTIEASPPECSADPSAVSCADGDSFFQVAGVTTCPTSLSNANLYFQAGAIPAAGTFTVLPAASIADALAVTGTDVAVQLTRSGNPTESWWGQSGTVNVQVIGNRLFMDFSGISAFEESNHSRTTTLGGFLICAP